MNEFFAPLVAAAFAVAVTSSVLTAAALAPARRRYEHLLEAERARHRATQAKLQALEEHNLMRWARLSRHLAASPARPRPKQPEPAPPTAPANEQAAPEPAGDAHQIVPDYGIKMYLLRLRGTYGEA